MQLQTRMACSFSNAYGLIEHGRNVSAIDLALPNPESFYPAKVSWTTLPSPGYSSASDWNNAPVAMPRQKTPSESAMRRQEMFRSGRLAAYSALQKAGFSDSGYSDSISNLERNSNECVGTISDAHRIRIVGKNPDRSPCWPRDFVGSISHSDRWVLAVAAQSSDYQSLGIDSEIMVSERLAKDLQLSIGSPSEWKLLGEAGIKMTTAFTLLFSAKEAFYKCWYPLKKKFMEHLDVAAYDIKPDPNVKESHADYGIISLQPRIDHAYEDKREVDAMRLAIRYCFTSQDVFTIAILPN